jgi:hypothetical protein
MALLHRNYFAVKKLIKAVVADATIELGFNQKLVGRGGCELPLSKGGGLLAFGGPKISIWGRLHSLGRLLTLLHHFHHFLHHLGRRHLPRTLSRTRLHIFTRIRIGLAIIIALFFALAPCGT